MYVAFDLSLAITLDAVSRKMQLSTVEQFRNVVYEQKYVTIFSMWGVSASIAINIIHYPYYLYCHKPVIRIKLG